jgi:uncharacterized protein YoxC
MSGPIQIAIVVLLALLVGAMLPLLLSAFGLVKQTRKTLATLEERSVTLTLKADQALAQVNLIAEEVHKELPTLQRTSQQVSQLGDSIEKLTTTVHKIQAAGNIIGPAIAAGLNAYRLVKSGQPGEHPSATPTGSDPAGPADPDELPTAVTDAILAEIKAQAEANGDLPAPADKDEPTDKDAPAKDAKDDTPSS